MATENLEPKREDPADIRDAINDCIHMVRTLRPSRETSIVITKLEEALMWLERGSK